MADGELRERIAPGSAPVAAIGKRIGAAFLPHGYPASVTEDYLGFQVWDTVQGLCSYIRGMLTSQAILTGVGVGQQSATPLSAVFQFFVRDFLGMLGGIVFTASQGSSLDRCAKQWRFFADLMNNVGLLLELAAPHFPRAFLLLVSLGSVARSITGVAAGATRAALTQHFALRGNAADISAKEGSQETAVTLLGMVLGIGITHCTAGSTQLAWAVFAALTVLHVYANRNAVRALVLTALNEPRLRAILQVFQDTGEVPSPAELPAFEPLLPFPLNPLAAAWRMPLRLGASVRQARRFTLSFSNSTPADEATDPRPPSAQPFPLCLAAAHAAYHRTNEPFLALLSGDSVVVLLSPGIGTPDLLRAFVHGHTLQLHAQSDGRSALRSSPSAAHAVHTAAAQHAAVLTRTLLPRLEERGWNTSKVQLPVGGFRCRW